MAIVTKNVITQILQNLYNFICTLAHKLVLSQIHKALGLDQVLNNRDGVGCGVSAAPFDIETFMYFQSLDIIVHEFFGCTETCGPQTTNMAGKLRYYHCNIKVFTLFTLKKS